MAFLPAAELGGLPRRVARVRLAPQGGRRTLNSLEYEGEDGTWAEFERYQRSLRKLLLEEVREVPVTMLAEQPDAGRAAEAVREVLTP